MEEQTKEKPKLYEITCFQDVIDKVPVERIPACMSEISALMVKAKEAEGELLDSSSGLFKKLPTESRVKLPKKIEWIDDGKESFFGKEDGDE